jgi:translocation and assembly module TamB
MKRLMKKIGKILGVVLALLLAFIVALFLVIQLPFIKGRILERGLDLANEGLLGRVEVGRLEGDLLSHARLRDIAVYDARDQLVLRIDSAQAHYRLSSLLAGHLVLDSVEVDGLLGVMRRYEDGTWNVALITEEDDEITEPGEFPVFIDRIDLRDAMILYVDEQQPRPEALQRQRQAIVDLIEGRIPGVAPLHELPATMIRERLIPVLEPRPALPEEYEPFAAPAAGLIDAIGLEGAFAILGQQSLRAEIERFEASTYFDTIARELTFESDPMRVDFAPDAVRIDHEGMRINGQSGWAGLEVLARFQVTEDTAGNRTPERLDDLAATWSTLRIDRSLIGRVAPELPVGTGLEVSLRATGDQEALRLLATLRPLDAPGQVEIVADLRPELDTQTPPAFTLSATASDLVPHRYWEIGPMEIALGAELWVDGRGNDLENLELSTRLTLSDVRVDAYQAELFYLEGRYDRGWVEVRPMGLLTPYVDLFGSGVFDPTGSFTATLRTTADADQTARAADLAPLRPTQADLTVDLTGSFDPDVEPFIDSLNQVQLAGTWAFQGFEAEDIRVTESRGQFDSGVVRRPDPRGTRYDSDFRLQGQGRGLSYDQTRIGGLEVSARGQGQIILPIDDPFLALQRLDTSWTITTRDLRFDHHAIGQGRLRGQIVKSPDRPRRFGYDLTANLDNVRLSQFLTATHIATELAGQVTVDPGAQGLDMVDELSMGGNLTGRQIVTEPIQSEALSATVEVAGPPTNLRGRLAARFDDVHVEALDMNLATLAAQLELSPVRNFVLEATALRPQDNIPVARLDASGQYHEDLQGATLSGLAFGTDRMVWAMQPPGQMTARADAVRFDDVRLTHDEQAIGVTGIFRPGQSQDLTVSLKAIGLEELRHGFYLEAMFPPVEGRVDLDTTLTGTSTRPRIGMTAELADFHVEGQGPFEAGVELSYADDSLSLSRLNIAAFERPLVEGSARVPIRLNLEGATSVLWDRPIEAAVTVLPFDFSDFHRAIPWLDDHGVTGASAGRLILEGTPERPQLDMRLSVENFTFQGEIADDFVDLQDVSFETELTYEPVVGRRGGIAVSSRLDWQGERVATASAAAPLPLARWLRQSIEEDDPEFDWDGDIWTLPVRLQLQVPELALSRLPIESARQMQLQGRLRANVDLRGTLGNPAGQIDLGLHTLGFDRYRDIYIDLNARLAERTLQLDRLRLEWDADEILLAKGAIPLPLEALIDGDDVQDLPGQFSIQLRELPIAKLSAIDYTFARIRGSVAAYLTFDGTLRQPNFEARVGLFNTELGDRRLGTISASLRGQNNLIEARGTFCREYETLATAEADLPVLLDIIELVRGANPLIDGPLRAVARGQQLDLGDVLPLMLIEAWVTDPDGDLDFFAQVTGTWEQPDITGHVTLEGGALTLPRFGRRFEDIETRIALDDENVHIRRVSLRDGPSSLTMEGTILHRLLVPQRAVLSAQARDFNLAGIATEFPVYVSANVDTWADLEASPQAVGIEIDALEVVLTDFGDRDLHPSDMHQDVMVLRRNAIRTVRDPRDLAELTALRETGADALNMRVDVNVARNSWLRHPNGDVNIEANVTADLLGDVVALTGSGRAIRGDFEFLGRRFVVEESVVTFTGAVPPNPVLQIEATHPMDRAVINALGPPSEGEPRIIIRVAGTAAEPRLELLSDPAMTDTEILFVLMTGRPPDRRDGGQEEGVAARALGAVSGLFFGMLQERLAGSIPVDVLRLEAGARGFSGGRLEVGKYITSDLFLAYRHQFGADENIAANVVRGEYHFLPRSMLELIYTDRNEISLNVFWDIY